MGRHHDGTKTQFACGLNASLKFTNWSVFEPDPELYFLSMANMSPSKCCSTLTWFYLVQLKKKVNYTKWNHTTFNILYYLRCAGVLRVRGAFSACGGGAADVLRDGHGQDVGRLLHQRFQCPYVSPTTGDPTDDKTETFLHPLATFTEQTELEPLLIIWKKKVNLQHYVI